MILNKSQRMTPVKDLKVHPENPRVGDLDAVCASIEANGFYGAVVAQVSTKHVLAGNHRMLAARKLGMAKIPTIWVDVDDAQALKILLADNKTSDLGSYDESKLAELLEALSENDMLDGTGYDADDLSDLLSSLEPECPDEVADPAAIMAKHGWNGAVGTWSIHTGDVAEVIGTLEGEFDAVLSDPPYGISFLNKGWDKDVPGPAVWNAIAEKMKPGAHLFGFGGSRKFHEITRAIEEGGLEIRDCMMWLYTTGFPKGGHVDGFSTQLRPAWEPIVVARKDLDGTLKHNMKTHGTGAMWIQGGQVEGRWPANVAMDDVPDRFFFSPKSQTEEREAGLEALDAVSYLRVEPSTSGLKNRRNNHPTLKPIALTRWLATLALVPRREDSPRRILVPFSGSGSEMIGCLLAGWDEVVGIELNPDYVKIAEERVSAWTKGAADEED